LATIELCHHEQQPTAPTAATTAQASAAEPSSRVRSLPVDDDSLPAPGHLQLPGHVPQPAARTLQQPGPGPMASAVGGDARLAWAAANQQALADKERAERAARDAARQAGRARLDQLMQVGTCVQLPHVVVSERCRHLRFE
jgi:hypothetical protein